MGEGEHAMDRRKGPLNGIRVLDLTSVVFGPFGTRDLADMGADVIKIEAPEGDIVRMLSPTRHMGMSGLFLHLNRNKRSVVLDLKREEGLAALLRLVPTADVIIHNMRPQAIAQLGISYEVARQIKPNIIFCNAWGYGSGGPYADWPAYDDVIQGLCGIADLFRRQSGGAPAFVPSVIADKTAGLALAQAVLYALVHRLRTGEGQEVEVPMYEFMVANVLLEHLSGAVYEPPTPDRTSALGHQRALSPHRKPYPTSDGFIAMLPYNDKQWRQFFEIAGRPDLAGNPRYSDFSLRSQHIVELQALLGEIISARSTAEWLELLRGSEIPHIPVKTLEDVLDDPHLEAVGFFPQWSHPTEGPIRTTAVPIRLGASPGEALQSPAPLLGEHSQEVLEQAGFSADDIAALLASGACKGPSPRAAWKAD